MQLQLSAELTALPRQPDWILWRGRQETGWKGKGGKDKAREGEREMKMKGKRREKMRRG